MKSASTTLGIFHFTYLSPCPGRFLFAEKEDGNYDRSNSHRYRENTSCGGLPDRYGKRICRVARCAFHSDFPCFRQSYLCRAARR